MHFSYVYVFAMQFIRVIPVYFNYVYGFALQYIVHFNYVYVFAVQFISLRVIQCTLVMCMCLLCN